jgi:tRNA(Ile)-lysidine synthase
MPELTAGAEIPLDHEDARRLLAPALGGARRALLAVSGGPDSVAMMRLFARLAQEGLDCELQVATVDHGLRSEARREAQQVGAWARECGLVHSVLHWEGRKPVTRIQERARAARYALLGSKAREIEAELLVTAHTLDDQAETVLMRISHGSGIAGLAGMRPVSEREGLVQARPFLGVAKTRLVATCRANGWPFIEDPSNADPRFARTRWRKLAPALAKEGLTATRLARLAERAGRAEEALEAKAQEAFDKAAIVQDPDGLVLDMGLLWRDEPQEIALRVLLRALALLQGTSHPLPIRLDRVENLLAALGTAFAAGERLRRTAAGAILAYDGKNKLSLTREGPRRRGRAGAIGSGRSGSARASDPSGAKVGNTNALLALV